MSNQEWKPVHGYEGFYEVTTSGIVRSMDRIINLPNGKTRRISQNILTVKLNNDNYLHVRLSRDGITKTQYIHRLVAQAFIPNISALPEVNHINGDKSDNSIANLEWCSHRENVQHAYDNDLTSNQGGTHSFAVGVTDNLLGKKFDTIKEWCDARGIAYSTGRNILNNGQKSKTIDLTGVVKETNNKINK